MRVAVWAHPNAVPGLLPCQVHSGPRAPPLWLATEGPREHPPECRWQGTQAVSFFPQSPPGPEPWPAPPPCQGSLVIASESAQGTEDILPIMTADVPETSVITQRLRQL